MGCCVSTDSRAGSRRGSRDLGTAASPNDDTKALEFSPREGYPANGGAAAAAPMATPTGGPSGAGYSSALFEEEGAVLNRPLNFTMAERDYVRKGTSEVETLQRLCEVEEMRRSELFAAWCLDSQRISGRFNRRRPVSFAPSALKRQPSSRLIIHARTVSVIDEHGAGAVDDDESNQAGQMAPVEPGNFSILGDASFRAAAGEGYMDVPTPHLSASEFGGGFHGGGDPNIYTSQGEFLREAPRARESPLLAPISARHIAATHKTKCLKSPTWHFLNDPRAADTINAGNGFFGFACKSGDKLNSEELAFMSSYINVSQFADEVEENNVPVIAFDEPSLKPFVVILVKAMYALPGVRVADINATLIASPEYNMRCQPGNPKIWTDVTEERTMRCTKSVIRFVYSIVIQMKIQEITDDEQLRTLSLIDGIRPCKAIILERTKRNKANVDSTTKCKSLLLYYSVDGGVLVSHCTAVLNTQVPSIVASVVNNFGSSGAVEASDTANLTRAYCIERFGDHRDDTPPPAKSAGLAASGSGHSPGGKGSGGEGTTPILSRHHRDPNAASDGRQLRF